MEASVGKWHARLAYVAERAIEGVSVESVVNGVLWGVELGQPLPNLVNGRVLMV